MPLVYERSRLTECRKRERERGREIYNGEGGKKSTTKKTEDISYPFYAAEKKKF